MNLLYFVLFILLVSPIINLEIIRYDNCFIECNDRWTENELIKKHSICSNTNERFVHGKKVEEMCTSAERENDISSPRQCALEAWWKSSLCYTLFHQMTDSYFKLAPLIMGVVLFSIFMYAQHKSEKMRITELKKMFGTLFGEVKQFGEQNEKQRWYKKRVRMLENEKLELLPTNYRNKKTIPAAVGTLDY